MGEYGSAAYNILSYKSVGWPMEMTTEQIAKSYPSFSGDLLVDLVRVGYTELMAVARRFPKRSPATVSERKSVLGVIERSALTDLSPNCNRRPSRANQLAVEFF